MLLVAAAQELHIYIVATVLVAALLMKQLPLVDVLHLLA
jgi:hypothetical protein